MMGWLGRDVRVQTAFGDGICWLTFGQERDAFGRLRELSKMLGMPREQSDKLRDKEDASRQLQPLLQQKRLLLMLDDVWRLEQAEPFKRLASGASVLLTTREVVDFCGEPPPPTDGCRWRLLVESRERRRRHRGNEPRALEALLVRRAAGMLHGGAAVRLEGGRRCCGFSRARRRIPDTLEAPRATATVCDPGGSEQGDGAPLVRRSMLAARETPPVHIVLQLLWGWARWAPPRRSTCWRRRPSSAAPTARGSRRCSTWCATTWRRGGGLREWHAAVRG